MVRTLVDQAADYGSVTSICYEGGEPLLFLPILLTGIRYAKERGFSTGVVTNAYQARSPEDAELLVELLEGAGLDSLTVSDDSLHFGVAEETPARHLLAAAERTGLPARTITVEPPSDRSPTGGVMFRGRAVDRMTDGLPRKPWMSFDRCPHANPLDPGRVHVDCFGNIHFCQGIVIGNVWKIPLGELFARLGVHPDEGYVDACHLCFEARRSSLAEYLEILTPPQVYGR